MPGEAEAMFVYFAERHYQRALRTLINDVSSAVMENWRASICDGTQNFFDIQDNASWARFRYSSCYPIWVEHRHQQQQKTESY
jgi:hypothetical protein